MMTDDAKKVLAGFARLSSSDQQQVIDEINRFLKAPSYRQKELSEQFSRSAGVIMGPVGSGCPCCGR